MAAGHCCMGHILPPNQSAINEGAPTYKKGKDRYEIKDRKFEYEYEPGSQTILPRVWSSDPDHVEIYRENLGLAEGEKPSFGDNMKFMFQHQIGWMYVRYFFFNFAGRESDIQNADWLSPLNWFEKLPAVRWRKIKAGIIFSWYLLFLV